VTTKERLHKLIDELSDPEADDALVVLGRVHERQTRQTSVDREIAEGHERVPRRCRRRVGDGQCTRGDPRGALVAHDEYLPVRTVPRALLTERITTLAPARLRELCEALAASTGC
jgi:hypothetical protein